MKEQPKLTEIDKALGATYPGEIEDYAAIGTISIILIITAVLFGLWCCWHSNSKEDNPDQRNLPAEAPLK